MAILVIRRHANEPDTCLINLSANRSESSDLWSGISPAGSSDAAWRTGGEFVLALVIAARYAATIGLSKALRLGED